MPCFPLIFRCKNTNGTCCENLDVDKDNDVDQDDAKLKIQDIREVFSQNYGTVKGWLATAKEFSDNLDIEANKLLRYLRAAEKIFANDRETLAKIKLAIGVLELFSETKEKAEGALAAASEVAGALYNITIPETIKDVGSSISQAKDANVKAQKAMQDIKTLGINVGVTTEQFTAIDTALNKVDAAYSLWSLMTETVAAKEAANAPTMSLA